MADLAGFLRPNSRAFSNVAGLLMGLAFLIAALWYWEGGVIDPEGASFARFGWEERGLAERVFDPESTEWGGYQGRELSSFINYLDALWLGWLVRLGHGGWLAPLSGMVSFLLSGWVIGWFTRRSGGGRLTALLMMAVYWSTATAAVTMLVYHRSSRPCLLPVLLAMLALGYDRIQRPRAGKGRQWRDFACISLLSLTIGLLDRQGFLHGLMAGAIFISTAFLFKRPGWLSGAAAVTGAVLAMSYNRWLGPVIIHAVNGYWPRFDMQQMPIGLLLHDAASWDKAAHYLGWVVRHMLGGTVLSAVVLMGMTAAVVVRFTQPMVAGRPILRPAIVTARSIKLLLVGALAVAVMGGLLASFAGMISRMNAIHQLFSTRLYYYPTSVHGWLLFGMILAIGSAIRRFHDRGRRVVNVLLALIVIVNLCSWPAIAARLDRCTWFHSFQTDSRLLQQSLRESRPVEPMDLGYAKLWWKMAEMNPQLRPLTLNRSTHGNGFYNAEFRDGRWLNWAEAEAFLKVRVKTAGPHQVTLEFFDAPRPEPHTVEIALSEKIVHRVEFPAAGGWVSAALKLDLPKGETKLQLRSSQPARTVAMSFPGSSAPQQEHPAAFAIAAPLPAPVRVDAGQKTE